MNELVRQAAEHWAFVSPLLRKPETEAEYDSLVSWLDDVLALTRCDPEHPLTGLASAMGDIIEAYDEERRPIPPVSGAEALGYLMREHGMQPSDLGDLGDADAVTGLMSGRVPIGLGQAHALAARFSLPVTVFLSA